MPASSERIILDGRYAILPDIVRPGGMAKVYKATDMDSGRLVAVKVYDANYFRGDVSSLAFHREMKSLQRLAHPNIVELLDGGRDNSRGWRYIVAEWLDEEFYDHIGREPIRGWDDFFHRFGKPILGALQYLFDKGVVHRDLKPENILIAGGGIPKLIDFGISRISDQPPIGATLIDFRTPPYSPPEVDDGTDPGCRDAWAYAAVCIACLASARLKTYDSLYDSLEQSVDLPIEIENVLSAAVSRTKSKRYRSIVELAAAIETAQKLRESYRIEIPTAPISISPKAEEEIRKLRPKSSRRDIEHFVVRSMNEEAVFSRAQANAQQGLAQSSSRYQVVSGELQYLITPDRESLAFLVIVGARLIPTMFAERSRQGGISANARFRMRDRAESPSENAKSVGALLGSIEHELARKDASGGSGEEIFDNWKAILRAKQSLDQDLYGPVAYSGIEISNKRIVFRVNGQMSEDQIGAYWGFMVDAFLYSGEVERVTGRETTIYFDRPLIAEVPDTGALVIDDRAGRIAINRQLNAVDAIRFGRAVNQRFKDIIVDPAVASAPQAHVVEEFYAGNLDDRKKEAVQAALGTSDMFLVQGPPGTGKTEFIVETIRQTLSRNPHARILLTSQTHTALDNALQRLLDGDPNLKALRIGHDDERVSPSSRKLLLQSRAEKWKVDAERLSDGFLQRWALTNGVPATSVRLGRLVAAVVQAEYLLEKTQKRIAGYRGELRKLAAQEASDEFTVDGTTSYETSASAENLRQELNVDLARQRELRARVDELRSSLRVETGDGAVVATWNVQDLKGWEEAYAERSATNRKFSALLDVVEDWRLRFSQSDEFLPAVLSGSQVVAGTCIGFAGTKGALEIDFDLCIIDEASKATATETCVPLSRSNRAVLVGDERQLPPFIEDRLLDKVLLARLGLEEKDVRETLFERLCATLPPSNQVMLSRQHRMCPEIGRLISRCFYRGELDTVRGACELDLSVAGIRKPVTWVTTSNLRNRRETRCDPSYQNMTELQIIRNMLRRVQFVLAQTKQDATVAVLSGYAAQVGLLRAQIEPDFDQLDRLRIECGTVDSFQGRQADIGIFSVTRSNLDHEVGFLGELRRLNVALSRAKEALVIVGDHDFAMSVFGSSPIGEVAKYVQRNPNDCYIKVEEETVK